jgi:hypothetical protein
MRKNGEPSAWRLSSAVREGVGDFRDEAWFCVSFSPPSYPQITQFDADEERKSAADVGAGNIMATATSTCWPAVFPTMSHFI